MTDKKVMIDGVNVAGCGSYAPSLSNGDCMIQGLGQNESILYCFCKDNPNCYYKQLQRLQAENVELKVFKGNVMKPVILSTQDEPEIINLVDRYKQALEAIRQIIINYDDWDLIKLVQNKINEVMKDE